jgi:hypothetical protein
MFVEAYDVTTLRQGDIIADVPFPLSRIQARPKFLGTLKQAPVNTLSSRRTQSKSAGVGG